MTKQLAYEEVLALATALPHEQLAQLVVVLSELLQKRYGTWTIWLRLSLLQLPGRRTLRRSLPTPVTLLPLQKSTFGAFQKTKKCSNRC
jgi:hypothetical protein